MRIKIDIDNTIRDIGKEMLDIYNGWCKTSLTKKDIKHYDVNISFPLIAERFGVDAGTFFFKKKISQLYMLAKPMKDTTNGLKKLKELGHEIILVSYQPNERDKEYTLSWLERWHIPYDALVFVNKEDKTVVPADYIIDDNPVYLDADSAKKVCIDWAYNRNGDYDYRVKSIMEFADILEQESQKQKSISIIVNGSPANRAYINGKVYKLGIDLKTISIGHGLTKEIGTQLKSICMDLRGMIFFYEEE